LNLLEGLDISESWLDELISFSVKLCSISFQFRAISFQFYGLRLSGTHAQMTEKQVPSGSDRHCRWLAQKT